LRVDSAAGSRHEGQGSPNIKILADADNNRNAVPGIKVKASGGQRPHGHKQVFHLPFAQVPGDENNAASAIEVGPAVEFDGRMGEMLNELHHDRPDAAGYVEEALHPQEIGTT